MAQSQMRRVSAALSRSPEFKGDNMCIKLRGWRASERVPSLPRNPKIPSMACDQETSLVPPSTGHVHRSSGAVTVLSTDVHREHTHESKYIDDALERLHRGV